MTSAELAELIGALAAGAGLGWLYWLALWATVHAVASGRRSGTWMAAMGVLRLGGAALVLSGAVLWGGGAALLAALCGFVVARIVFVRTHKRSQANA